MILIARDGEENWQLPLLTGVSGEKKLEPKVYCLGDVRNIPVELLGGSWYTNHGGPLEPDRIAQDYRNVKSPLHIVVGRGED